MRVYLSGMPELRLGLNDKILFETTGRMFQLLIN
jgi:AP-1 complex subunit mu